MKEKKVTNMVTILCWSQLKFAEESEPKNDQRLHGYSKMADNTDYKNQKKVEKKDVYVAQTAEDIQRRKIEKLMSNPVSFNKDESQP